MKNLYNQQKTLILRNFIEKVWRYGNKVLSLQKNRKSKDNSIEIKDTGFRCLTGTGILYFLPL